MVGRMGLLAGLFIVLAGCGTAYYYRDNIAQQLQQLNNSNSSNGSNNGNSTSNTSSLPSYLNECVTSSLAYHAHAHLSIVLNGLSQTIPANVGINAGCLRPLHTHLADGVIHIEPSQNRTYTLGDFFLIWGEPFNSTQVMGQKFSSGQVSMTVNGVTHSELGGYVLPENGLAPGYICSNNPCQDVEIVITAPASSATG